VAAKVVLRQMVGIIPGFELLVNRPPAETAGPLFRRVSEVTASLAGVPWPDALLGLGTALALTTAYAGCLRTPLPRSRLWPWALGFAGLANLPIAFSAKYQVFILHREYPYAYAYYSFYFAGVAAMAGLVWLGQGVAAGRGRHLLVGAFGLGSMILGFSALASNRRVLQLLLQKYN
jgi:hypothetical protein